MDLSSNNISRRPIKIPDCRLMSVDNPGTPRNITQYTSSKICSILKYSKDQTSKSTPSTPSNKKKGVDKACDIAIKFMDAQYKWHILCLITNTQQNNFILNSRWNM